MVNMDRIKSFIFLLFCWILLSASKVNPLKTANIPNYPDFQEIVRNRQEEAKQKANWFSRWMDNINENLREMENYDVKYYFIDIEIDFEQEFITAGNSIKFEIMENNVSQIQLHFVNNLTDDEIQKNGQALDFTHADDLIEIDLGENYNAGEIEEITVFYSGYPDVRLEDGLKFEEHNGTPIAFTMVSPRGARKWLPCKDTPADKPDSLAIWITYPEEFTCASNGNLNAQINNGNGTKTDKWFESYPITTYLISLAITNYQMYNQVFEYEGTQMPINNYIYPEQWNASVELYGQSPEMLNFLSSIYGTYPFLTEKYGNATCTNLGASAMEHQTCTSWDAGLIGNPAAEYTSVHETAHHWAGDCLSIGSWSHVWLKEGFASYSEALWAEHLFGFQGLSDYMLSEDGGSLLDECLYRDENGSANHIFNWVVYAKGSWTLHMLRGILGDEVFFQLMFEYMQDEDYIYGNVLTEDLENKTEEVCGYEMDWFFDEWFYHYGRPRYKYASYTSEIEDSVKVTVHSEGSQGDPFSMFIPYLINEQAGRFWIEDGFNYRSTEFSGDLNELFFDPENWVLDYGYEEKIPHLLDVGISRDGSILILWEEFFDHEIIGFNIYRRIEGQDFILLNPEPVSGVSYFDNDVEQEQEYFYKIAVVFRNEGNYLSKFSNEISLVPVDFTFDEGILLIDGTEDYPETSPFPTDEEVDGFYHQLIQNYTFSDWDINESGIPPLTELARYSTLIWHTDDIANFPFNNEFYNIKSYLLAGGNLLLSSWKQLYNLPADLYEYFLQFTEPEMNPNADFIGTFGNENYPDITVDTNKIPLPVWNEKLPYVHKFLPLEQANAIFLYDSAADDPDWENQVCGLKYFENYKLIVMGFPLYFMELASSSEFIEIALQEFGELSEIEEISINNPEINLYNFPNPFSSSTTIFFNVTQMSSFVNLNIYNLKGQKVRTFQNLQIDDLTKQQIVWDGTDENHKPVLSGIYLYRIQNEKINSIKKMILLR